MKKLFPVQFSFWQAFLIGFVCAILLFMLVALSSRFSIFAEGSFWGSIITGIMTLVAGLFAWFGVQRQIAENRQIEEEKRKNELTAIKPLLANCLSRLIKIVECNIDVHFSHNNKQERIQNLPQDCAEVLRDTIRYADAKAAKRLANIIHYFQVYNAREDSFIDKYRTSLKNENIPEYCKSNMIFRVIEWATLHALLSSIFEFARDTNAKIPERISSIEIKHSFIFRQCPPKICTELIQAIDEREKLGRFEIF